MSWSGRWRESWMRHLKERLGVGASLVLAVVLLAYLVLVVWLLLFGQPHQHCKTAGDGDTIVCQISS